MLDVGGFDNSSHYQIQRTAPLILSISDLDANARIRNGQPQFPPVLRYFERDGDGPRDSSPATGSRVSSADLTVGLEQRVDLPGMRLQADQLFAQRQLRFGITGPLPEPGAVARWRLRAEGPASAL